jgi:membrane protease YdiL (CAAX protease family)
MEQKKQFPTIIHSICIVLFWIIFVFVLGFLCAVFLREQFFVYEIYFLGFINSLTLGLVVTWGLKKSKIEVKSLLKFKNISWSILALLVLYALGFAILFSEVDNTVKYFFPMSNEMKEVLERVFYTEDVWALVFVVTFVASITEEFLCRGFLLKGLMRNYSRKTSVIVTSLLFAALHLNPWGLISYFSFGVFSALVYLKTKNLFYCIFFHGFINFASIFFARVVEIDVSGFSRPEGFQPLWFNLLGVFFVTSALLLTKLKKEALSLEVKE